MALKVLNEAFSKSEMAASTGKTLNPQKTEEILGIRREGPSSNAIRNKRPSFSEKKKKSHILKYLCNTIM